MVINKKLIDSKIVLFFGAGFSSVLNYPTMKEFVKNHLLSILSSEELYIIRMISLIVLKDENYLDLEEILNELDKITSISYAFNYDEYIKKISTVTSSPGNFPKGILSKSNYNTNIIPNDKNVIIELLKNKKKFVNICRSIIYKIKKKIFKVYSPRSNINYRENYDFIFDSIYNLEKNLNKYTIPIFTTNYDNVLEEYFNEKSIQITNGFGDKGIFNSDLLVKSNYSSSINVFIFHLHGSIYFYEDKEFNCIRNQKISYYMEDERYKNKIIYPMKDKTPKEEPFFTYYDYLLRCLDKTEYVIFFGYSFRDYETLIRIKSSLIYNNKLRIIIIDYYADDLKKEFFNNDKRVCTLSYFFESEDFRNNIYNELVKEVKL